MTHGVKANWIGGEWLQGVQTRRNLNPSDLSDIIGEYSQADRTQALLAVDAARAAFPVWSVSTGQTRADILDRIGTEILARRAELGTLLSREEGKTLAEGIGEVVRAGNIFKFYAGEAVRLEGNSIASLRPGIQIEVTREPLGVVAIISPWNFPIAIPAWKIAPALAYGNCVVFKPADLVPGSAWALSEIISRSGLPAGVFNLVMGRGRDIGQILLESSLINGVTFTGSTETGQQVMKTAGQRMAKIQLEMGGKNPLVILSDANIDQAVEVAVQGAYYSTGQRCTASSRFIIDKSVYGQVTSAIVARLKSLAIDHALKDKTDIGPVADESQLAQDIEYLSIGRNEGATLLFGGERLVRDTEGFYLSPALFSDAHNTMRIAQEEIFGPIACAIPVDNYEHALMLANDTKFGLTAGICTSSLKYAQHFKRHAEAGMVMVNIPTAGVDYHVPFGGRKGSSYGSREQGRCASEFYTIVKTSYTGTDAR